MPEDPASHGGFELEKLRELIELMEKHGLTEISLRRGDESWRLRRGANEVQIVPAGTYSPAPLPSPAPAAPTPAPPAEPSGAKLLEIKSPTVGTFYSSPSPDDPPFVAVGTRIERDTVVCIIEAMKVFNQIQAEVAGTIAEILVNNGDPVEFGQLLFRVRP